MTIENNPLKQYFRRPAIYLKLPSGGNYPPGVVEMTENGELPVYPMTAIDDITSKTPDSLYNGAAMVDIIKSCIPSIKDPWRISSIDFDAILIAVRSAASGNEMEVESVCPACGEDSKYGINLVGLLSGLKAGDYDKELEVNDLLVKFKPLTYKEMSAASINQFELQKMFSQISNIENEEERSIKSRDALKTITGVTMKLLSHTIEYIKTPTVFVDNNEYILDFLQNCDKIAFDKIKTQNAFLKQQTEIKPLKMKCTHCQHEYDQPFTLNAADFFD